MQTKRRSLIDEFSLISKYFRPLTLSHPSALGLLDDAAVLEPSTGTQMVISCDALVADVHFPDAKKARDVAARALRVNLSDLAAMGASPVAYTLALVVPKGTEEPWFQDFAEQLGEDQEKYGIRLIGGDTVSTSGPLTVSITVLGEVPAGLELKRSGAKIGDSIFVTGTIGDACLGLRVLKGELKTHGSVDFDFFVQKFVRPEPRLALGVELCGVSSAAVDISDGLLADIEQMCTASDVGAVVRETDVPLSSGAEILVQQDPGLKTDLLDVGDDYELVLAVPPESLEPFHEIVEKHPFPVTEIGFITEEKVVSVVDETGILVRREGFGYKHFF